MTPEEFSRAAGLVLRSPYFYPPPPPPADLDAMSGEEFRAFFLDDSRGREMRTLRAALVATGSFNGLTGEPRGIYERAAAALPRPGQSDTGNPLAAVAGAILDALLEGDAGRADYLESLLDDPAALAEALGG